MDGIIKQKKIAYTLVYANYAIICFLVFLLYKYKFSLFSLGGSSIFVSISVILIFLMGIIRPLVLELSFAILTITGILIINFLSYWEISVNNLDTPYWIVSFICLFCFVNVYISVVRSPFKKYSDVEESNRGLFRKILLTLLLPNLIMGLIFAMFSALMVYSIRNWEPNVAISYPLLRISYVAVAWLVISFLVTFIYLLKIKDKDIRNFIINEKLNVVKFDTRKIKIYFTLIYFLIIFFGSIIETQRGMWVMWIETILLLGLMSLIIWKIYKHVFLSTEH